MPGIELDEAPEASAGDRLTIAAGSRNHSELSVYDALATLLKGHKILELRLTDGSTVPAALVGLHAGFQGITVTAQEVRPIQSVENPPKPFTPNKYTRILTTLDGRKVPVDIYCVLAAFPTGSAAVDHAVKKQLAPGARGVKSRLQDLKEAHASLGRAIELEEANAQD